MKLHSLGLLLAVLAAAPAPAAHHPFVDVAVEVDGRDVALYPAPDGSGRLYLEARKGSSYAVRLANRSGERLAVQLLVDGLNVVSGGQEVAGAHGRMYVLDPWDATTVRGWRTSLDEIRRFTFVDEKASYAERAGKANARMGWIEVAVFREKQRKLVSRPFEGDSRPQSEPPASAGRSDATPPPAARPEAQAKDEARRSRPAAEAESGYPGTGWGQAQTDRVAVVAFEPESTPVQRATLRYEYRRGLQALGVIPQDPVRLHQRDRGDGFVQPPSW